jgi:hypothetical protein
MTSGNINWKIHVKRGTIEVEVDGLNIEQTEQLFERIAKKAFPEGVWKA